MKKVNIALTLLFSFWGVVAFNSSCSNEDVEDITSAKEESANLFISTKDGLKTVSAKEFTQKNSISAQNEEIEKLVGSFSRFLPKTRAISSTSNNVVKDFGVDEMKVISSNLKARLLPKYATLVGLTPGTYFIDVYRLRKRMSCRVGSSVEPYPDYEYNSDYKEKMGLQKPDLEAKRGFFVDGPSVMSSSTFNGDTYFLLISKDILGRRINRWYPYNFKKENMVWIYRITDPVDWNI